MVSSPIRSQPFDKKPKLADRNPGINPPNRSPRRVIFQMNSAGPLSFGAVEVIGDESQAMRWLGLGTPVRALDYATPVSLLHLPEGREAVLAVLGRLEHGVL